MIYNKEDYLCNFSPRVQRNLDECGFSEIDIQKHITTLKTFWVYEKDYNLQLYLGMCRVNKEKSLSYEDNEIISMYKMGEMLPEVEFEEYDIKINKFTKNIDISEIKF